MGLGQEEWGIGGLLLDSGTNPDKDVEGVNAEVALSNGPNWTGSSTHLNSQIHIRPYHGQSGPACGPELVLTVLPRTCHGQGRQTGLDDRIRNLGHEKRSGEVARGRIHGVDGGLNCDDKEDDPATGSKREGHENWSALFRNRYFGGLLFPPRWNLHRCNLCPIPTTNLDTNNGETILGLMAIFFANSTHNFGLIRDWFRVVINIPGPSLNINKYASSLTVTNFLAFSEVAELLNVCWLYIQGKIQKKMLPPNTYYAVYHVFKIENSYGLDCAMKTHWTKEGGIIINGWLKNTLEAGFRRREWMDGDLLGDVFFNNEDDDNEVEMRLHETSILVWKRALL
ncbi:hypothetical protein M9H77_31231 [Catharanthus roseus]|uniref:Uncharacterized protein n=1 Tax=Catharanthus roseus TaxID=4058 RepID=A0ACC0A1K5_CATRO|nr:hypothetical protein M9H77_31231 [Catharanthus roseus]